MKKGLLFFALIFNFFIANAAAPTIQASGINFPEVGCNAFEINWTNGNGTNRIVAVYPGAITVPGGAYVANQIYNSGAAIGGGKVVYNGTGSSVIVVGLAANTTYTIVVYEYNAGPTYLTTTTNSITVTTDVACTNCPTMTGAVINGCNSDNTGTGTCPGGCGEGDSEILLFNSGSYGFVTRSAASTAPANNGNIPFVNYFSAGSNNIADAGSYVADAALTATLNGMTGCANSFIDASAGAVPPWSTIMIVRNTFCSSTYTLTSLCASFAPIYVLYVNPAVSTWAGQNQTQCSTGNFSNGAGAPRYFNVDFSEISVKDGGASSASCNYYYTYDWASSNDGDGITFSGGAAGTTSTTATSNSGNSAGNCDLPIVLPIQLISFTASKTTEGTQLNWATISETNNDYFEVEYAFDAINFTPYTKVKGAGNSHSKKNYTSVFNQNVSNNNIYFRLKQVDFNGNYKYSDVITLGNYPLSKSDLITYYNIDKDKIVIHFNLDFPQQVNISLYDLAGVKIQETSPMPYSEGDNEVLLNAPDKIGIYLMVYQANDGLAIHKKIMVSK